VKIADLTTEQISDVAKKYCELRMQMDGYTYDERGVHEQTQVALCMHRWMLAFQSVIGESE
jgi:hypothetical protein